MSGWRFSIARLFGAMLVFALVLAWLRPRQPDAIAIAVVCSVSLAMLVLLRCSYADWMRALRVGVAAFAGLLAFSCIAPSPGRGITTWGLLLLLTIGAGGGALIWKLIESGEIKPKPPEPPTDP